MKLIEILKIGREMLKMMSENDIKTGDWKYIDLFDEYNGMRQRGIKYRYVTTFLSEKYGISRTKVERIIRRFSSDVK